jgi:hypothetical protein
LRRACARSTAIAREYAPRWNAFVAREKVFVATEPVDDD